MRIRELCLVAGAAVLLAGCWTDGNGGSGGGSGGGGTVSTLSIPQQGVTGEGGVTDVLGVSALVDPLLGTDGALGGGGEGRIGGVLPTEQLAPLSEALAPVVDPLAAAIPYSTLQSTLPPLGATGEGGLVDDLLGQDPVGPALGTNGLIGAVASGGSGAPLGAVVPEGAVPTAGLGGSGGLSEDLTGQDLVAVLLGASPVTEALGGGQEGAVGGILDAAPDVPVPAVPTLGTVAELGVAGTGGIVDDLLGGDVVTPLLGTTGLVPSLLQGGNDGTLGNILPPADGTGVPSLPGLTDLPGVPALPDGLASLPGLIPLTDVPGTNLPGLPALPDIPELVQEAPTLATTLLNGLSATP